VAANAHALTELDVAHNRLGDEGLRPLFEALPLNTHLRTLDVSWNDMNAAFAHDVLLPAVRANTSLRTLHAQSDVEHPAWQRRLRWLQHAAAAAAARLEEHRRRRCHKTHALQAQRCFWCCWLERSAAAQHRLFCNVAARCRAVAPRMQTRFWQLLVHGPRRKIRAWRGGKP
jgi:hypothetical protein